MASIYLGSCSTQNASCIFRPNVIAVVFVPGNSSNSSISVLDTSRIVIVNFLHVNSFWSHDSYFLYFSSLELLKELKLLNLFHKNNVSRDEKLMLGDEYVISFLNDAIVFSYTVL